MVRRLRKRRCRVEAMRKKAEALLQQALELGDTERAELAGVLLESLEPPADTDVEQAWRAEVAHRLQQIEAGKAEFVPWDQVRDRLLSRLNAHR
jgi:putative addiction module component (TIGR02574 family)